MPHSARQTNSPSDFVQMWRSGRGSSRPRTSKLTADLDYTAGFQHVRSASRLLLRADAVDAVSEEADRLGCQRLMLVAGRRTSTSEVFTRIRHNLGSRVATVYDEVVQHAGTDSITKGLAKGQATNIDGLVAVGGGSAIDTAKAIALVLAEGGQIEDHASVLTPSGQLVAPPLSKAKLPIFAVPLTASAAEVTPGLSVRGADGRKLLFWDAQLAARVIFLDPKANLDVPAALMARTAMNALAHAAEGLYSLARSPITDAIARESARRLGRAMPAMAKDPRSVAARGELLLGAHLSGHVISNARTGIGHAVCHCLGALGGLTHGDAHSVMLPHVLRFNRSAAPEALQALGAALLDRPESSTDAEEAIRGIQSLQQALGLPTRLRDLGVDSELLPEIAQHAVRERGILFNPLPVKDSSAVLDLLKSAW
ncbi:iron-containing alcohol dehydrogenase family protein [Hydrogenophaga sp. BPS33]|uniref:iron-containing alcohol dehydrogenase family protein n=1 Tax=Hydrogenophaga sp. BPS33 TaxID=2651974 RepID=UPI00131FBCCA|nr:iron-containing alcohol dehydrogenase [Hydrogenophaga sp. BPS33]QHE89309.1 iron-containing alcohol dehydrogenase [Hydrogenophaga sp. BPS33]